MENYLHDPLFKKVIIIVLSFLGVVGALIFPIRKKNTHLTAAWASIQSWILFAPVLFLVIALGSYWPLLGVTFISLLCAKEFFQITGMYHKSVFVWLTYFLITFLAYCVYRDHLLLYEIAPMIFLGVISLVPIVLNDAKKMLQYIALSLLCSIFVGWAFMHTAWILKYPLGAFFLFYIILLSELCDNVALAVSRLIGKKKIADRIVANRTVEGLIASFGLTLVAAYFLRVILPQSHMEYWWVFGLIAALVGSLGDLILAVIRRDLGVRDYGIFIIGRGGVLDRMDRLIFVAPIYYYVLVFLERGHL